MNLCQRVHVLATGRSLAAGVPKEVMADIQVRQAYLGSESH
jgi:ABC-type branched-subunit amino acid transport system ATPase component